MQFKYSENKLTENNPVDSVRMSLPLSLRPRLWDDLSESIYVYSHSIPRNTVLKLKERKFLITQQLKLTVVT